MLSSTMILIMYLAGVTHVEKVEFQSLELCLIASDQIEEAVKDIERVKIGMICLSTGVNK